MSLKYVVHKEPLTRRVISQINIFFRYLTYLRTPCKFKTPDTVFFIIDPSVKQAGLVDRFKAIINTYYIAKSNGLSFKLYFKYPFDLEKYLLPNEVDWHCQLTDLDKSICSARLEKYYGELPIPKLEKGKQYHYYWYRGKDLIRYLFSSDDNCGDEKWKDTFSTLFHELFNQSHYLSKLIKSTGLFARTYVSVHFRFVNSLGNFEGNLKQYPILSNDEQDSLIEKCINYLSIIAKENVSKPIIIFSDSSRFLQLCEKKGYHNIGHGNIGNIAVSSGSKTADKTMLDFFVIGNSYSVYSIVLHGMYGSVFAEYAAIIGGASFKRISE